MEKIDYRAFCGLPWLECLGVSDCELYEPPLLQPLWCNLEYLSLAENNITTFPLGYFDEFVSLQFLLLSRNYLTSIPATSTLAQNLKVLSLSHNRITSISGAWRENNAIYAMLIQLFLDGNLIVTVDTSIMKVLPRIEILDLGNNFIKYFEDPAPYLPRITRKYDVRLAGNPLDCGHRLAWITSARQFGRDALCATPACKAGAPIPHLSECIYIIFQNYARFSFVLFRFVYDINSLSIQIIHVTYSLVNYYDHTIMVDKCLIHIVMMGKCTERCHKCLFDRYFMILHQSMFSSQRKISIILSGEVHFMSPCSSIYEKSLSDGQKSGKPWPLYTNKTRSYWYRDSHYKTETAVRPSEVWVIRIPVRWRLLSE